MSQGAAAPAPERGASVEEATLKAVSAAKTFLVTLDDRLRSKVEPALNVKTRANWSNLPSGATFQNGATERNGVKLGDLTPAQQEAALALVAATLSASGYQKVINIVNADETLERTSAPTRLRPAERGLAGRNLRRDSRRAFRDPTVDDSIRRPSPRD